MECEKCHSVTHRVAETREEENGTIRRRRVCQDCGHRFTTLEIPPGAVRQVKHQLKKWAERATGDHNTKIRQRRKIARAMCPEKRAGATAAQIAKKHGMSVHMAHYYTSPTMMEKLEIGKT